MNGFSFQRLGVNGSAGTGEPGLPQRRKRCGSCRKPGRQGRLVPRIFTIRACCVLLRPPLSTQKRELTGKNCGFVSAGGMKRVSLVACVLFLAAAARALGAEPLAV